MNRGPRNLHPPQGRPGIAARRDPRRRSPGPFVRALRAFVVTLTLSRRALGPLAALTTLRTLAGSGVVLETATEYHALGDFDGDGRDDIVIVEKTTGLYRLAYQAAPGKHTWLDARASGITDVTGISVGRVLSTTRDTLALASPQANRVNLFEATSPAFPETPVSWFPPSVGPKIVIALDIGGAGNTAHDDLYTVTTLNEPLTPVHQALARSTAAGLSPLSSGVAAARYLRGQCVRHKAGGTPLLGLVAESGKAAAFHGFDARSGALVPIATATGLPPDARFVAHPFAGGALSQFLFFQAGRTTLQLRSLLEPTPGAFEFAPAIVFNLGHPLEAVMILPGNSETRLLILFQGGSEGAVYRFDGVHPPALVEAFSPALGQEFTGASPLGNSEFLLFQGAAASGRSTQATPQRWNGQSYIEGRPYSLPEARPREAGANVFVFQKEPFLTPNPALIQRLSAGDWASQPEVSGSPLKINVVVETFTGATNGLGAATGRTLGDATPPGTFALANQYLPGISLFSLAPPVGDEVLDVQIQPPAGPQATAIQVTLTTPTPGARIFYRRDSTQSWTPYGAPFVVYYDTTIEYYAQPPGSDRKSVIHSATYLFPSPAAEQDSDQDGVPDYVELGLDADNNGIPDYLALGAGLDPVVGNKDSDGDGYGDLDEYVAGTNPYANASVPAAGARLEDRSGFDLFVAPRPLDGTITNFTHAQRGVNLRLHSLAGELLRQGSTTQWPAPAPAAPSAWLTNIVADTWEPLLSVSTDPHFAIQTASPEPLRGRELIGLMVMPALNAGIAVNHQPGTGTLRVEAAAWRTAAQAAAAALPRLQFARELRAVDSLAALLFERKIELLLRARGWPAARELTLFPFRAADRGRQAPGANDLRALEGQSHGEGENAGPPAYRLAATFEAISNALAQASPPTPEIERLRRLADELYRISSAFHQEAPSGLPLPVEVLRGFLRTGNLHSNYVARTSFTAPQLAEARVGAEQVLALATPRPIATLELTATAEGVTRDCTTMQFGAEFRNLVFPDGSAYLFPSSFQLVPGSVVRVTGYTDLPAVPGGCPGTPLEVLSASVTSVPAVATVDDDHDLLPDNYEFAFFGDRGANPSDDADLDGFTNLQEFLDGTDPRDRLARGRVAVRLGPPQINVRLHPNRSVGLSWTFPAAYAHRFKFGVRSGPTLEGAFMEIPVTVIPAGGDAFEVQLPEPATATAFYRVYFETR